VLSPRRSAPLGGIAALGALALVLSGCAGEEQTAVGVDELRIATLGTVTPSQQAFIDRMTELSEGTVSLDVTENWQPADGGGSAEDALAKAVLAGEVDLAWITVRSLGAIGVDGVDSVEAPLLIQTHDQQRAVALGVPGEMIRMSLRTTGVAGLALLPGPTQYPVASGAPVIDVADWAGKTVQVSPQNPAEAATVEVLGATVAEGTGTVADVVAGSTPVTTANPVDLVSGGAGEDGPFLTSNVALWPRMEMILINRDILDRLSNRQNGFLDASVVRAQDLAMAGTDLEETVKEACKADVTFGTATADQLVALNEAVQPVYDQLKSDPVEAKLLEAIQDVVQRNAGTGAFSVPKACRWVAPKD
jgi:TRAP-type C4-dicarboxylate transport system substrate-binding protein